MVSYSIYMLIIWDLNLTCILGLQMVSSSVKYICFLSTMVLRALPRLIRIVSVIMSGAWISEEILELMIPHCLFHKEQTSPKSHALYFYASLNLKHGNYCNRIHGEALSTTTVIQNCKYFAKWWFDFHDIMIIALKLQCSRVSEGYCTRMQRKDEMNDAVKLIKLPL